MDITLMNYKMMFDFQMALTEVFDLKTWVGKPKNWQTKAKTTDLMSNLVP